MYFADQKLNFDLFFKNPQTVTIAASDDSGDAVTIEYLLSDKELPVAQLDSATFTAYTRAFSITPDNKYVIYARLTDTSDNVTYISSKGLVLDENNQFTLNPADGGQTIVVTDRAGNKTAVIVTVNNGHTDENPKDHKCDICGENAGDHEKNDTKSSQTGDNSHMALWILLLATSVSTV